MFQLQCQLTAVNFNFRTLSFQATLCHVFHIAQKDPRVITKCFCIFGLPLCFASDSLLLSIGINANLLMQARINVKLPLITHVEY